MLHEKPTVLVGFFMSLFNGLDRGEIHHSAKRQNCFAFGELLDNPN
jgi:hypothetical protein